MSTPAGRCGEGSHFDPSGEPTERERRPPFVLSLSRGGRLTSLAGDLTAAREASRQDRINHRNAIAAHGAAAIEPMILWVQDSEFGAFAVRVLERIAQEPTARLAVVRALAAVPLSAVDPAVARDIGDIMDRLMPSRTRGPSTSMAGPGPGYRPASPLEERFHQEMLAIYDKAGEATRKRRPDGTYQRGYWATYFLRGVRNHGGLPYAKRLLEMEGTTDGFARLQEEGRLDLTMEALILKPEYRSLFRERELQTAASRLARAGYDPGRR